MHIFAGAVNELLKTAKDLDKLSCSVAKFTSSVHHFVRLSIDEKTKVMKSLERKIEKYVTGPNPASMCDCLTLR